MELLLLIDAAEGVQEQSRRHGYLLHLLGIQQVIVAINKMDLAGYSQQTFESIKKEYLAFLGELGVRPQAFIPLCARDGDNLAHRGATMPWYDGPTIVEALDGFVKIPPRHDQPLRLPVQDVYKFDQRRIVAGRVESGTIAPGDQLLFSPSGHKAVVKTVERWQSPLGGAPAQAGESVGITLTEQLFIERGDIVSHLEKAPRVATELQANIFWLGDRHLAPNRPYVLKLATQEVPVQLASIKEVVNSATLDASREAQEVAKNEVATVILSLKKPAAFDLFADIVETGRFVIVDGFDVAGGGIIQATVETGFEI
jgi:bifunctional enzyme CysN/CysC